MAALDVVLRCTPSHWKQHANYNNVYIKVTLNKDTEEYKKIENIIRRSSSNLTVSSIDRIQHPFAFGRFCIRKQQLTLIQKREPTVEQLKLFITDKEKIDLILRHNCDNRRGGFTEEHTIRPYGLILIVKVLNVTNDKRDSDRYPEYLITYTYRTIRPHSYGELSLKRNPLASKQHNTRSYESTSTATPMNYKNWSIQPNSTSSQADNRNIFVPANDRNSSILPNSRSCQADNRNVFIPANDRNSFILPNSRSSQADNRNVFIPANDRNSFILPNSRSSQADNRNVFIPTNDRNLSILPNSRSCQAENRNVFIPTNDRNLSILPNPRSWQADNRNVFPQQPARASYQRTSTAGKYNCCKCILL